jgi:flagellar motor switch protein FliG
VTARESKDSPGPHKVAAFLLSLDKEISAQVMRHLDPKIVSDVAEAMTELEPDMCTADAVDGLYEDLARTVYKRTGVRPQDDFELHEILESTFGDEEAQRVIGDIYDRRRKEQPFAFVEQHNPEVVARVLGEESPGVVALVMAHIAPAVSAEVLAAFSDVVALDIVKRMTNINPPGIETMLAIADDLQGRLVHAASMPPPPDPADSLKSVAELLNFSGSEIEKSVLEGLEEEDEQVAGQVREFMFTWEDLSTIEKRAMQKILASVDTRTLSMSLKGCSAGVETNIMNNLSSRVREMVADERELAGPVPLSEVVEARNEIMLAVRGLMDSGEFSPVRSGQELVN